MKVGFHYLEDSDGKPALPAAVFLEPNEWGKTRGHVAGGRSALTLFRPYFKGNPEAGEIAAKIRTWTKAGQRATVLNEPNLAHEDFKGGPAAYRQLFAEVKSLVPDRLLYWAGMSPGVPWKEWYDGAQAADGICVHAYGTFSEMREVVEHVRSRFPGKPIWVKESNFAAGREVDVGAWARNEFRPFLDWCDKQGIEAVTYFAWIWPNPDSSLKTPLDAVGTEIETVLRAWQPTGPVVVQEDGLKARLLQGIEERRLLKLNRKAALQKRILADGFVPNSSEFELTHQGVVYVAQVAEQLQTGALRCYYCKIGDWDNVRSVAR